MELKTEKQRSTLRNAHDRLRKTLDNVLDVREQSYSVSSKLSNLQGDCMTKPEGIHDPMSLPDEYLLLIEQINESISNIRSNLNNINEIIE